jgi:hypothetical protein
VWTGGSNFSKTKPISINLVTGFSEFELQNEQENWIRSKKVFEQKREKIN